MSEHKQSQGEGKLPLPSPRSPRHLDDKILAYAREKAPEKRSFLQPRWTAALATAGVVVLALFITEPQQQTPGFSTPAPMLEEGMRPRAARTESMKAKPKAPTARIKMSRSTGQAAHLDKAETLADEPLLEQEIAADTMAATIEADEDMTNSAIQPLKLTAADAQIKNISSKELSDTLQLYANMLDKGEEEQARAAYQQLRQACPDCILPDTLAEALATLPEAQPAGMLEQ